MDRSRLSVVVGLLLLGGCGVPPPGELVGEYSIQGTLLENTCGSAALPAKERLNFTVQIRDEGFQALWLLNPPGRAGTLDADGDFDFKFEYSYFVEASQPQVPEPFITDPEAFDDPVPDETEACTLIITERMRGSLSRDLMGERNPDEDTTAEDLEGSNRIDIRAANSATCGLVMQTQGGPFESLPCNARYDIEGNLL